MKTKIKQIVKLIELEKTDMIQSTVHEIILNIELTLHNFQFVVIK